MLVWMLPKLGSMMRSTMFVTAQDSAYPKETPMQTRYMSIFLAHIVVQTFQRLLIVQLREISHHGGRRGSRDVIIGAFARSEEPCGRYGERDEGSREGKRGGGHVECASRPKAYQ